MSPPGMVFVQPRDLGENDPPRPPLWIFSPTTFRPPPDKIGKCFFGGFLFPAEIFLPACPLGPSTPQQAQSRHARSSLLGTNVSSNNRFCGGIDNAHPGNAPHSKSFLGTNPAGGLRCFVIFRTNRGWSMTHSLPSSSEALRIDYSCSHRVRKNSPGNLPWPNERMKAVSGNLSRAAS